jgi:toxin ParE1/3/4
LFAIAQSIIWSNYLAWYIEHSLFVRQPVKDSKRELVIGRAMRGYVVLYRYVAVIDAVFVPVVRAQREDGFKR